MNPSLDVREVFRNPGKAIAAMKAGKTINLIDDDGHVFARVTPEEPALSEQKESTAKKKHTGGNTKTDA